MKIKKIHAREILDSRSNPTIEVEVSLENGVRAKAAVPSGASTGALEALELRDNDPKRFHGKGVLKAVNNVNSIIAPKLQSFNVLDQNRLDEYLNELDGTANKASLGANAILGVSLAVARAAAKGLNRNLYEYLHDSFYKDQKYKMPIPMFNIINGGVHAENSIDFQEFMIVPQKMSSFKEGLEWGAEIYQVLKSLLKEKGLSTGVGDEGGFAPDLRSNEEAIEFILKAIEKCGLKAGKDICIALDPATSELYKNGKYVFFKSNRKELNSDEMISFWKDWISKYPICSIEDGLAENDWDGWKILTKELSSKTQLVGDDIFVTNPKIFKKGIEEKVANAILIKLNQIGTLSETISAIKIAKDANYNFIISHRSGETSDDFIADLAVASGAYQIKSGAPCRGERLAKYNRLLRIEEQYN